VRPARSRLGWLAAATAQIDVTEGLLVGEALAIGLRSGGTFRYADLRDMEWPLYEGLVERVKETQQDAG
jgi:hypothetical protein